MTNADLNSIIQNKEKHPQLGDVRTEHFTLLTIDEWKNKKACE